VLEFGLWQIHPCLNIEICSNTPDVWKKTIGVDFHGKGTEEVLNLYPMERFETIVEEMEA
jgi:hypothetical protein